MNQTKRWWRLILAGAMVSGVLSAGPSLTLTPAGGAVSGAPGQTIGWGFTLTNAADYLVPSMVTFCNAAFSSNCTTPAGVFTDFAAQFQTIVVGPGATFTQAFSAATQSGIGSFTINPNAAPGGTQAGTIYLVYDLFSCDITKPTCNPTQTAFSQLIGASASVRVTGTSPVPEPGTISLLFAGAMLLGLRRRR